MKNVRTVIRIAFIATLTAWLPLTAVAADAPPRLSEMWTMVPKADHRDAFFEAFTEHMKVRAEAGDPRQWMTYTQTLGENLSMVAVRYCCFNWADADSYREWSESAEEVQKHWSEKVDPHVAKYGHYYDEISWVNSNIKSEWGPYRYFAVTEFKLKTGQAGQFDAARDEVSQIAINQGWATEEHPWLWSTSVGGEPTEMLVIPMKKYADMERGETSFFNFLSGVLGSDESAEALLERMSSAVESQQVQIWELHENLSMPASD
jgi:hypothetical protein